jgi:nucleotide-binding universal stress UspA family protein
MKLLLAIDDSACSRSAIEFVRRMTWPTGTEVIVLSVAPSRFYLGAEYPGSALYIDEAEKQALVAHEKIVTDARSALTSHIGAIRTIVLQGDPRVGILDAVREEAIDLVVMGSHGRSGLAKLALGSVASHVVTHAACTVTVVKEARGDRS